MSQEVEKCGKVKSEKKIRIEEKSSGKATKTGGLFKTEQLLKQW